MIYDVIIVGAGASGLFAACNMKVNNGLILNKSKQPAMKILMSGNGSCNITNAINIKDFLCQYGNNGKKIRSLLYQFSNLKTMDFFQSHNIPLFIRDDMKVFPKSLNAKEVADFLIDKSRCNGFEIINSYDVTEIEKKGVYYNVNSEYKCKKLIIACGGSSYPATGSDGKLHLVLQKLGIKIQPLRPALVPITVEDYQWGQLAGMSFQNANVRLLNQPDIKVSGDLLLTHKGLSGPSILNLSRFISRWDRIEIDFTPSSCFGYNFHGISSGICNALQQETGLPRRFLKEVLKSNGIEESVKVSTVSKSHIMKIRDDIRNKQFVVSNTGGFNEAMVTVGGISLDEIDLKTMENKNSSGLYFIGEVIDIDGNTGGFNFQFAFSSAYAAAMHILKSV